ncbi:MAG: 30S ribosomal protein S8 [Planctomycetota bacterium]
MSLSDPIADMLTRIRNAVRNNAEQVRVLNSKVCRGIAQVLQDEGYIQGYDVVEDGRQGLIRIELKYGPRGEQVINLIRRESKPGRRVYTKVRDLPRPLGGLGICILTTPQGVLSDRRCRAENLGGELLCTVE